MSTLITLIIQMPRAERISTFNYSIGEVEWKWTTHPTVIT